MAKQKTQDVNIGADNGKTPQVVQPAAISPTPVEIAQTEIEIPDGHVLIVALKDGEEVPGSEFLQTQRMADLYYTDTDKYVVKKKGSRTK